MKKRFPLLLKVLPFFAYAFIALSFIFMTGCSNTLSLLPNLTHPPIIDKQTYKKEAQSLLDQAKNLSSPQKEEYELRAINLLLQAGRNQQAEELIVGVNRRHLNHNTITLLHIVEARLLLAKNEPGPALNSARSINIDSRLPLETRIAAHELRADAYLANNKPVMAVGERATLSLLLNEHLQTHYAKAQENEALMWQILKQTPAATLKAAKTSITTVLNGWIALAEIDKKYSRHDPQRQQALSEWEYKYPSHPAKGLAKSLMGHTTSEGPTWNAAPSHIALLLPLDGKLGSTSQAFRDGFLEAYYTDKKSNSQAPTVTVINTKGDANVVASYQEAVSKGANFIVGPLTKSGVVTLNASKVITVPTLALNKIAERNQHADKLYHYSLAPEDEAIQVAKQARRNGNASAVIIAEQSDWGNRTANAFAASWKQLGGQVVGMTHFTNNEKLDLVIKKAFQVVDHPKEPGGTSSFSSRNDVDMVFLASRAEEAAQIRPFIYYYYSDKLPVYGTASIYVEAQNSTLDRDMDGIIFCDMPWIIDPHSTNSALRAELGEIWNQSSIDLSRLYAMGADAYQITKQLGKTNYFSRFSYRGTTGYLTLGTEQNIHRELMCAKLSGGRPRVIH